MKLRKIFRTRCKNESSHH